MHAKPGLIRVVSRRRNLGRSLAGCLLSLPATLFLAACSHSKAGEVMVVVTTDMALPSDLDSLDWRVTRSAHPDQAEHGTFALGQFNALPATLAIVAENGEESVLVSLDGKSGDSVRVHREAQLTVPAAGEKMLKMPLNWLCSEINPGLPCAAGMTCEAGQCVSSQITGPLADYAPLETSPCFDVQHCTLVGSGWRAPLPTQDDTGACIIDANMIPVGPVNVALVVDTAAVGNAGVCTPSSSDPTMPEGPAAGQCFVPINQDNTPDGWQFAKDSQGRNVIRLPAAVCEPVGNRAVQRVALTRASTGCPIKTSEHPLCDNGPGVCVDSPGSCPGTFPASWSGYSCSGAASPSTSNPSLTYCPVADSDPEVGPVARGHVCCTAGQEPGTNPLLIDDMSGGPLIKLPHPPDESAGNWFTSSDDGDRPLSPPQQPGTLFTYRAVTPAVTPETGTTISSAACFRMREGFSGTYALEGFSFFSKGSLVVPVDVSQYTGLTFWAQLTSLDSQAPAPIRVVFPNSDTDTEHKSSTCLAAGLGNSNCNHFGLTLQDLTSDWQKFTVTWDQLTQSPNFGEFFGPFDTSVYSIDFEFIPDSGTAAPFDFCVSQIYFTQ
jgi:hypothetical protein